MHLIGDVDSACPKFKTVLNFLALAGIGLPNHPSGDVRMYYRRTFTIPSDWVDDNNQTKYQINFGAVDWESEVYVNGKRLGIHQGG